MPSTPHTVIKLERVSAESSSIDLTFHLLKFMTTVILGEKTKIIVHDRADLPCLTSIHKVELTRACVAVATFTGPYSVSNRHLKFKWLHHQPHSHLYQSFEIPSFLSPLFSNSQILLI